MLSALERFMLQERQEGMEEGRQKGIKEGRQKGIKEGRQKGKTEGRNQTLIEITKNMLKKKMTISTISELTGLSEKEIKKLQTSEAI